MRNNRGLYAPPPPSYDESQRLTNAPVLPYRHHRRQAPPSPSSAPHNIEFAPSAPSMNLYIPPSASESVALYRNQPSEPPVIFEPSTPLAPPSRSPQPSAPLLPSARRALPQLPPRRSKPLNQAQTSEPSQTPQPSQQKLSTVPFAIKSEKKANKLSWRFSSLNLKPFNSSSNTTGTNQPTQQSKIATGMNSISAKCAIQSEKLGKEVSKLSSKCTSQGYKLTQEIGKIPGKCVAQGGKLYNKSTSQSDNSMQEASNTIGLQKSQSNSLAQNMSKVSAKCSSWKPKPMMKSSNKPKPCTCKYYNSGECCGPNCTRYAPKPLRSRELESTSM